MPLPNSDQCSQPTASVSTLRRRSALLRKLRDFFYERDFIEVETPLLAPEIIPELHIEPFAITSPPITGQPHSSNVTPHVTQYLQASPELYMKRLLAAGAERIFQITRSFRAGEYGQLHNPEFTLVEWYRVGDDMRAGIDLLDELTQSLLSTPPALRTTYAEAFRRTLQIAPHAATISELAAAAARANVAVPLGMNRNDRDEWLNLLLAVVVEPQLGCDCPEIIHHYPATQASLARLVPTDAGYDVAERFELYYRGIELANGFHELTDAAEQRRRFEAVNEARVAGGRHSLPLPESLLAAMRRGLPDCTGCALGFDRLAMLAFRADSIHDVKSL